MVIFILHFTHFSIHLSLLTSQNPMYIKVTKPIFYVLQKLFLACFWLCACSSNR